MNTGLITMQGQKKIAMIAHDNKKSALLEWARYNRKLLEKHKLFATGTTGQLLATELNLDIHRFASGPLGATNKSAPKLSKGISTSSFSSGTRWNRSRMMLMSRLCFASRSFTISRPPAIGPAPTSSFRRR